MSNNLKEKFLQTVLNRNEVLEYENRRMAAQCETLELEIQRLQAIVQRQQKTADARVASAARLEQKVQQ